MPELRKDPIVDRWVIIAAGRAQRPSDYETTPRRRSGASCPFCAGNEDQTPAEVLAYRNPGSLGNGEGWRVRVVPNKFPALDSDGAVSQRCEGLYVKLAGLGVHEVIIESPRHLLSTAALSEENLAEVFSVYRDRLAVLKDDPRLKYGLIFKNVGEAAGASLEHAHSQLIATPIVPTAVRDELRGSQKIYEDRGRCAYCDMIEQELAAEKRIVVDAPGFVAFCPFAARFPFETWILPKAHASHYEKIRQNGIPELARIMKRVMGQIETALDRPAYNYLLHTGPFDTQELNHYHWHIEIIPRLTKMAGFEWGSGFHINPVPPEEAAALLREVEADQHRSRTLPVREIG